MVQFTVAGTVVGSTMMVNMMVPSFTTHSFSMKQRLLVIGGRRNMPIVTKGSYSMKAFAPALSGNLAPAGCYMIFVVHQDIPSEEIWIQIQ